MAKSKNETINSNNILGISSAMKEVHECNQEGCKSWEEHLQYIKNTPMKELKIKDNPYRFTWGR